MFYKRSDQKVGRGTSRGVGDGTTCAQNRGHPSFILMSVFQGLEAGSAERGALAEWWEEGRKRMTYACDPRRVDKGVECVIHEFLKARRLGCRNPWGKGGVPVLIRFVGFLAQDLGRVGRHLPCVWQNALR